MHTELIAAFFLQTTCFIKESQTLHLQIHLSQLAAGEYEAAAHKIVRPEEGLGHVEHKSGSRRNEEGHVDEPEDIGRIKINSLLAFAVRHNQVVPIIADRDIYARSPELTSVRDHGNCRPG